MNNKELKTITGYQIVRLSPPGKNEENSPSENETLSDIIAPITY